MTDELLALGLLKPRDVKKQDPDWPAVKKYFMHGLGHPIGLDVHDVGDTTKPMQAGWIMTVEPGIYIPEEKIAVRLENTVLVTENGPVNLMADIPIEADEHRSRDAPVGTSRLPDPATLTLHAPATYKTRSTYFTTMPIAVGTKAPDFTLKSKDANGLKDVTLSANFGKKNTVLVFFPSPSPAFARRSCAT
jgi:hypothetical protein